MDVPEVELTERQIDRLAYLFYCGIPWEKLTPEEQDQFNRYVARART